MTQKRIKLSFAVLCCRLKRQPYTRCAKNKLHTLLECACWKCSVKQNRCITIKKGADTLRQVCCIVSCPHRSRKSPWICRRPLYSPCGQDNSLELGRVSRRRVKIGLRLAGSHYNNYGRAAGKHHASVPLTVSPG